MTADTNEYCIRRLIEIAVWWGRNETFDRKKFQSIKGDFFDGGNG